jgi:hypothetical protein
MLGLMTVLFLGRYLFSLIGSTSFFDSVLSAQRLQVLLHHLPLLLLTGLLGLLAVFGYLATVRQRNFPRFVWLMMERAFILYVLVGIVLASTSTGEKLYVSVAPTITGDPNILEKQDVYETFVMLDTQLYRVHGYVLQAWEDAISKREGETLCIAPPGPLWSSEGLQLRAFPQSTLRVVNEGTLLLESWQATLEGIRLYEQVEATMLNSPKSETFQSPPGTSGGHIVCGKYGAKVVDDLYDSLQLLEEAQQSLNSWIELNGGAPATFEDEMAMAWNAGLSDRAGGLWRPDRVFAGPRWQAKPGQTLRAGPQGFCLHGQVRCGDQRVSRGAGSGWCNFGI